MSVIRPPTVHLATSLRLVAPDAPALPVPVSLRYDPVDPYAVKILFHPPSPGEEPVSWSFARDLLATGLVEPAGLGDVRLWPCTSAGRSLVALALSSPDGRALFEMPRSVVVRFLARSYALVPLGHEAEHLDIDGAVHRLLAPR